MLVSQSGPPLSESLPVLVSQSGTPLSESLPVLVSQSGSRVAAGVGVPRHCRSRCRCWCPSRDRHCRSRCRCWCPSRGRHCRSRCRCWCPSRGRHCRSRCRFSAPATGNRRRQHGDERQGESYVGACQLQFELPSTATQHIPSLQNATTGSGATQGHQDLFVVRWYKEMPSWAKTSER